MKTYFVLLFFFCIQMLFAQDEKKYKISEDIDGDGKIDIVSIVKSGGSSMETYKIEYKFAKLKSAIIIIGEYDYSSFICMLPIPDGVKDNNNAFFSKLSKILFGLDYHNVNDPAINWFNDISKNKLQVVDEDIIDFKSSFNLLWKSQKPVVNKGFATILDSSYKSLEKYYSNQDNFVTKRYLVAYYGNNHQKLDCNSNTSSQGIETCLTNHGVLLRKEDKYSWIFINDIVLFGFGSEKLRWPSLKSAKIFDNIVLVNVSSSTSVNSVLYVLNIKSGTIVRLNSDFLGIEKIESFELDDKKIEIKSEGKVVKIPLNKIFPI